MNDSDNARRKVKSPASVKSPAQSGARRRLAAILDGDQLAIRVTNLRARAGLKPKSIGRFLN